MRQSSRASRRRDRLADVQDPALHVGHHAFVLLLQAAREDDAGVARGLGHEEVHDAEELQLLQGLRACSSHRAARRRD
jgi:hypothetical protein